MSRGEAGDNHQESMLSPEGNVENSKGSTEKQRVNERGGEEHEDGKIDVDSDQRLDNIENIKTNDDKTPSMPRKNSADNANGSMKERSVNDQSAAGDDSNERVVVSSALQDDEEEGRGCCLRLANGEGCCGRCMMRWPRFWIILLGVVLPLWFLIALSLWFGYFLAKSEAPNEVLANNDILAAQSAAAAIAAILSDFVQALPKLCFAFYVLAIDPSGLEDVLDQILTQAQVDPTSINASVDTLLPELLLNETILLNKTDLYEFMQDCGDKARNITDEILDRSRGLSDLFATDLTFNWMRCVPWAEGLSGDSDIFLSSNAYPSLRPDAQVGLFYETWLEDQQRLYQAYLNATSWDILNGTIPVDANNHTRLIAQVEAYQESIRDATGGSACQLNTAASTWFWFTVTTTVGYGNQAPETTAGRSMVYTLGFASILAFAGILVAAGHIVSALFDDAVGRIDLKVLTVPWVACLVWGGFYYSWMTLIALVYVNWNKSRLDVGTLQPCMIRVVIRFIPSFLLFLTLVVKRFRPIEIRLVVQRCLCKSSSCR